MNQMAKEAAFPAQSQAFIAILSGLNRLNFLMRRLGGRRISWGKTRHRREDGNLKGKYAALESAADQQETCPKGSLIDRIAFLEERLVQMCLEIESCRRSWPSSSSINVSSASGASSSSNNMNNNQAESRIERMSSYPTFAYKTQTKQLPQSSTYNPFDSETDQTQDLKGSTDSSVKKKDGNKKEKKSGTKRKKSISPNWLPLNILGC